MTFESRTERRPNTMHLDDAIGVLEDKAAGARAEIWPALGFNCFCWQSTWQGQPLDLLYTAPQFYDGARASRSGIPILFPQPNRIRAGRFTWNGRDFQLPLNDPGQQNAIHGFACWRPWRVVDQGSDAAGAWITGQLHAAKDAPDVRDLWPADYRLRITYRLVRGALRIEAEVTNPDSMPLPFGLGYHPYFRVPFLAGSNPQDFWIDTSARAFWELDNGLPTGKVEKVSGARDLSAGRWFAGMNLDDVFTTFPESPTAPADGLYRRARLRQASNGIGVQVRTSASFRELVVFTPPHRQAVCLEPYTCVTDAINLQQEGVDAGLLVLEPGAVWRGVVELVAPG